MSSNNYTQVRDYVKFIISAVDSTLEEWTDALELGNIPKTLLNRSYHINIGTITSTAKIDKHVEDSVPVTLTIFQRAFNQEVETKDTILQRANLLRLNLIAFTRLETYKFANDANIEDCQVLSMTPSAIDVSNDNIIQCELELNVRLFFGTL